MVTDGLLYKPDWEQTKSFLNQWWDGENEGRCAIAVTARKAGSENMVPPPFPQKVEDRWLDFDYLQSMNEYHMQTTYFGGEAFPMWHAGYPGWDFIPMYLGLEIQLRETTGWFTSMFPEGALADIDMNSYKLTSSSKWFSFGKKLAHFAVEKAHGKSIAGIQAIGGTGDTLAALRSTNSLLLDLHDDPDAVRKWELYLMDMWIEVFDNYYSILKEGADGGTANFMGMWAPGKFYVLQNDFSYMISTKMLEDIFLPSLEKQLSYLDYTIYHVDGVGAFKHVDTLCLLPGLHALQILPGEGKPSPLYYMDVLKKVQKAGKNLHITIPAREVTVALENLSAKGLYISTNCSTEEEARNIFKLAEHNSKI